VCVCVYAEMYMSLDVLMMNHKEGN